MHDVSDAGDPAASRNPTLESYLSRLDAQLGALSPDERREILMETRSHVSERTARFPFPSVDEVLGQFDGPEVYARQFRQDRPPLPAASQQRSRRTALQGLARLAAGGWLALPVLLVVVFAYAIALTAFIVGLTKVISPTEVGVWVSDVGGRTHLSHAGYNAEFGGREILGYWLAVITFGIGIAISAAASAFLRWLARTDPRVTTSR
jgi:uncharacterized membrane protein